MLLCRGPYTEAPTRSWLAGRGTGTACRELAGLVSSVVARTAGRVRQGLAAGWLWLAGWPPGWSGWLADRTAAAGAGCWLLGWLVRVADAVAKQATLIASWLLYATLYGGSPFPT